MLYLTFGLKKQMRCVIFPILPESMAAILDLCEFRVLTPRTDIGRFINLVSRANFQPRSFEKLNKAILLNLDHFLH